MPRLNKARFYAVAASIDDFATLISWHMTLKQASRKARLIFNRGDWQAVYVMQPHPGGGLAARIPHDIRRDTHTPDHPALHFHPAWRAAGTSLNALTRASDKGEPPAVRCSHHNAPQRIPYDSDS